jgi:DnaJ-class molecular chaperone
MHVQVSGMFVHLCTDCLEEANLMETIYAQPCPHCHGSGREWEGWDCDHCDGSGTDDY